MAVTFLTNGEQTLTEEQKAQARENIGAGGGLSLHDIILDKSRSAELEGSEESYPFNRRYWEKRADGTFSGWGDLYIEINYYGNPEECFIFGERVCFPFEVYEVENASFSLHPDYESGTEDYERTSAILDTLAMCFTPFDAGDGFIEILCTDETYAKMTELDLESFGMDITCRFNGRWRE